MAKSFLKRRRNDIIYAILFVIFFIAKYLPRKPGLVLFGWLGRIFFLYPTIEKQRTFRHLSLIFSEKWSEKRIKRTAAEVYSNIGKNFFDALYLSNCSNKKFYDIVNHDDLYSMREAYDHGNGLVVINCHTGCFEMTAHILARKGFKCITIGQKLFDERVDKLIVSMRQRNNITYLYRNRSGRDLLRFFKRGYTLGVLLDQDTNVEGVFAHFLGLPAHTPSGPMRMAMRYNIPVFVAYSARQKDNTHYFHLSKRIELENTGDSTRDLVVNIEKVNNFLSEGVLKYPEQWVWMHRRWKKRPDDEQYKDIPNIENYID